MAAAATAATTLAAAATLVTAAAAAAAAAETTANMATAAAASVDAAGAVAAVAAAVPGVAERGYADRSEKSERWRSGAMGSVLRHVGSDRFRNMYRASDGLWERREARCWDQWCLPDNVQGQEE